MDNIDKFNDKGLQSFESICHIGAARDPKKVQLYNER